MPAPLTPAPKETPMTASAEMAPPPGYDLPASAPVAIRPKLSRRPASFSSADAQEKKLNSTDGALTAPAPRNTTRTSIPWQEDGLYGMVMLTIVLVVNLALIVGMAHLPRTGGGLQSDEALSEAVTMPPVVGREEIPTTTFYTQPLEKRRTVRLLDLRRANTDNNLSVSPQDIPVPIARALEE